MRNIPDLTHQTARSSFSLIGWFDPNYNYKEIGYAISFYCIMKRLLIITTHTKHIWINVETCKMKEGRRKIFAGETDHRNIMYHSPPRWALLTISKTGNGVEGRAVVGGVGWLMHVPVWSRLTRRAPLWRHGVHFPRSRFSHNCWGWQAVLVFFFGGGKVVSTDTRTLQFIAF